MKDILEGLYKLLQLPVHKLLIGIIIIILLLLPLYFHLS